MKSQKQSSFRFQTREEDRGRLKSRGSFGPVLPGSPQCPLPVGIEKDLIQPCGSLQVDMMDEVRHDVPKILLFVSRHLYPAIFRAFPGHRPTMGNSGQRQGTYICNAS
jgi:hypothetical protein